MKFFIAVFRGDEVAPAGTRLGSVFRDPASPEAVVPQWHDPPRYCLGSSTRGKDCEGPVSFSAGEHCSFVDRRNAKRVVFAVHLHESAFLGSTSFEVLAGGMEGASIDFLNSRIPLPNDPITSGSFPPPKTINAITRITTSSGIPSPNIVSLLSLEIEKV